MSDGTKLTVVGSKAVDFSFARPPVSVLVANGFKTVVRYISGSGVTGGGSGKNATKAELDTYLAAGLGVMLVWEQTVLAPLGGRAQGLKDGLRSWGLLRELGCPEDVPVLVAVDFDVTAGNIKVVSEYVRAFAENCKPFPIGVYGDADILLAVGGLSRVGWIPSARSWSSKNLASAVNAGFVHAFQGLSYNLDNQYAVDPNLVVAPFPVWSTVVDPIVPIVPVVPVVPPKGPVVPPKVSHIAPALVAASTQ